jgi:hypothetical protein
MTVREWCIYDIDPAVQDSVLPPDLFWRRRNEGERLQPCREEHRRHWFVCTRPLRHTGRHAAGTGSRIVAVWP